ncbi:hypothetical protein BH09PAT1_BH09PAT1_0490 [soil metagenome]
MLAVGGTAIAASRALLSDQATLAANTFSTGTVDLQVTTGKTGGTFLDSVQGFSGVNLYPGQTITNFFRLKSTNTSTDLSIAAQAASVSGGLSDTDISITFTALDSNSSPVGVPITQTLHQWESPTDLGLPNVLANGNQQRYKMDVTVSPNLKAGGASTTFDMVFTGTQVVTPTPTP